MTDSIKIASLQVTYYEQGTRSLKYLYQIGNWARRKSPFKPQCLRSVSWRIQVVDGDVPEAMLITLAARTHDGLCLKARHRQGRVHAPKRQRAHGSALSVMHETNAHPATVSGAA